MTKILNDNAISKLAKIFSSKKDILAAYLFGSRIHGSAKDRSDLDFAIIVSNRKKISERDIIRLLDDKGIKIPFDLDLSCVDLSSAPLFLHQIIKNGTCIYARNPKEKADLEAKIMHIYFDNQHLRNIYHSYLDCAMQNNTYGY